MKKKKILCVVGARPNFMKIAPIMTALEQSGSLFPFLVHTGQHYDTAMKHAFFDQLGITEPNVDLEVGSATHAVQTSEIMRRFEGVLDNETPEAVLVVGDVNSTIACALVACKKAVPVIHVEAGLRSYDRTMPEEINRVLTDQISDILFTTEQSAESNLMREGVDQERIHFVGNVMIDTLKAQLKKSVPADEIFNKAAPDSVFSSGNYAMLTLHRPSNVDNPDTLEKLLKVLVQVSEKIPLVFPMHPRTESKIRAGNLSDFLASPNLLPLPPLGYHEMLGLMSEARLVLTDSGGIQEETTSLGVPCLTLRENTERPITVEQGTNTVVGTDSDKILSAFNDVLITGGKAGRIPELWDGNAAQRIVNILEDRFS